MGLSEHEQQLLDDMERRLYQSEADVMKGSSGSPKRLNMRSLVLGILVILLGVGVLIAGVASQLLWLGLIGFVVMIGGVVLAMSKRDEAAVSAGLGGSQTSQPRARESMGDRAQRRWDQRMEGER